jgi:outer membrane protein OmpA-like peptidoglycan-associated protein
MKNVVSTGSRALALTFGVVLACAPAVLGQDMANPSQDNTGVSTQATMTNPGTDTQYQIRSVASGDKRKLKGTIVDREADTFTVRDDTGSFYTVRLTDETSVKSKGGFLRSGTNYGVTELLRGLAVEVEGRGNGSGELSASKIRFEKQDLKVARSIDTRVTPAENRLTTVEAQNRTLSGQVDELNEVSKAIKSDVARVSSEADRANAGVATTNERISALDDYDVQDQTAVYFKVNSAVLSPEGKAALDEIATKAASAKGYVIEVAGFTDSTGSITKNRMLSQRRADAVVQYLQENHDIPLRRMITPFGYGPAKAVADNSTREGREQNRRVEVKVLVSRGITQQPSL